MPIPQSAGELAVREALPTCPPPSSTRCGRPTRASRRRCGPTTSTRRSLADDDFHGVAVTACANAAVRSVLDQFTPALRRLERLRFASLSGRGSVAQHERIIALRTAGDVEGAVAATRANWQTLAPLLQGD